MPAPPRLKSFTDRYPYLGPLIWIWTAMYFAAQLLVALAWPTPYSVLRNPISDLGNTVCGAYDGREVCSPRYALMNCAFIAVGLLIAAGAPLIRQEFGQRRLTALGFAAMGVAGVGTALVGVFPENVDHTLHVVGAAGPFIVGNVALVLLSHTLPVKRRVRIYTGAAGSLGLLGAVLFALGWDLGLDQGGMERVAAYPQTIWLFLFGLYMCRNHYLSRRPGRRGLGLDGSAA